MAEEAARELANVFPGDLVVENGGLPAKNGLSAPRRHSVRDRASSPVRDMEQVHTKLIAQRRNLLISVAAFLLLAVQNPEL